MKNFVYILFVTVSIVQAFESSFRDDRSYSEHPKRISFSRTQTKPRTTNRILKRQFSFENIPHIPVLGLPPPMFDIPQTPEMIPMPGMPPMPGLPHAPGMIGPGMPDLPPLQGMPPIFHGMPHAPSKPTFPYRTQYPVKYEFGLPQWHEMPPIPSPPPVMPRIPEMPQRPEIRINPWRLHQIESTSTRRSRIRQHHPKDPPDFELDDHSLCKRCDDATSECEIVDRPDGNALLRTRNCRDENKQILSTKTKLIPNRSGIRRIRSRVVEIA